MPIPSTSREAVLAAVEAFNRGERSPRWRDVDKDWQDNGNFEYALVHDGTLYPVKEIIRLAVHHATGQLVRGFSGGDEANGYLHRYGFQTLPRSEWGKVAGAAQFQGSEAAALDRWDEFIEWAKRFYQLEQFTTEEREYKLQIAGNLQAARDALNTGAGDWQGLLKTAFGPPNNLTSWRIDDRFRKWCSAEPEAVRSALDILWFANQDAMDRIRSFLVHLPREVVSGPGGRLNLASFLLMVVDPHQYPVYRWEPFDKGFKLTGYAQPATPPDEASVYRHALGFLDRLIQEALARGLELHNRLDAQGVLWCVTKWAPPEQWAEEERHALRRFRGEAIGEGAAPQFWWVNQGTTYQEEREGGYLWAPTKTQDGKVLGHHTNVTRLKIGDIVLHYANGFLRAVSQVAEQAEEAARPSELPPQPWHESGYLARANYFDLPEPIGLGAIPIEWRGGSVGPFTSQGAVKQGYLFQISQPFVQRLVQQFGEQLPDVLTQYGGQLGGSQPRVVKIAPGEKARFWQECLAGSYICVGWDEVGDLRSYTSKEEFRRRFGELLADKHNHHEPTLSRKANEVWTLRELKPGDVVVANRGTSEILALGEVVEPGYEWRPDRDEYKHTVRVRWDTSLAQRIPEQPTWGTTTVADVTPELYQHLLSAKTRKVWLFQANPSIYHLAEEIRHKRVGEVDDWLVSRYGDEMNPGDIVILWQSGLDAGIYAVGELISQVHQRPAYIRKAVEDGADQTEPAVQFRFTHILDKPVPRRALLGHPVLGNLQVLRAPQGTNFKVMDEEWQVLHVMISDTAPAADYVEPPFEQIYEEVVAQGMRISREILRRYHLALKTRGFVILSGVSGTGKTWLTEEYARAVGAKHLLVSVAPNWTTNEDLLGYYNPMEGYYHDTPFSRFLRDAAQEYEAARSSGRTPTPYHVVLDEMNLARVEYYFAKFLSVMEVRSRRGTAAIELAPGDSVLLPPNLAFCGTVNVDETTHGFADKVYDRAQLITLQVDRGALHDHLGDVPYRDLLLEIWDAIHTVAPFAFRVLDEIRGYVAEAERVGMSWEEAFDEQLLQKVLPKLRGADPRVGLALERFVLCVEPWESIRVSTAKARLMLEGFRQHGFASYF